MVDTMKTNSIHVLIINDLDPHESKGAASMAFNLANRTLENSDYIFLSTSKNGKKRGHNPRLVYLNEGILDRLRDRVRNRLPKTESVLRVLALRRLFTIFRIVRKFSPQSIWVHQIGWRIPVTSLLIFRLLKIPTVFTIHDYSYLRFKKLYLHDFLGTGEFLEDKLVEFHQLGSRLELMFQSSENRWQRITRYIITKNSNVVYVSPLQSEIYKLAGYPVNNVITNVVEPCKCTNQFKAVSREPNQIDILFAGRLIGKGYDRLLDAIASDCRVHLHIAGGLELYQFARRSLSEERFTYHGFMESQKLFEVIHLIDVVAVPSICFDAYPTIALEAIAHGKPVISTPTTGTFEYSQSVDESLAIPVVGKIDLTNLINTLSNKNLSGELQRLRHKATNQESIDQYRKMLGFSS